MKNIIEAVCAKGLPKRDLINANKVNLLALMWAGSLLLGTSTAKSEQVDSSLVILGLFSLHLIISIGMFLSYRHFLTQLDEMERKIQLNALASSVGITIISFSCYSMLEVNGWLPELQANYVIALMALSYMAAIVIGRLKYR